MSASTGSVRMGPISLLALLFTLCLAVLSVLSVTTANATYASAQKQAAYNVETYANDDLGQRLVMKVDDALAGVRAHHGDKAAAMKALKAAKIQRNAASYDTAYEIDFQAMPAEIVKLGKSSVKAIFTQEGGRSLNVVITINDDATYSIAKWQTSTLWQDDTDENFWTPGQ